MTLKTSVYPLYFPQIQSKDGLYPSYDGTLSIKVNNDVTDQMPNLTIGGEMLKKLYFVIFGHHLLNPLT